jgi:hypothetical protein
VRVSDWVTITLGAVGVLFTIGLLADLFRDRKRSP